MDQLPVTFMTVPATMTVHLPQGHPEKLSYRMIVGIKIGRQGVHFRHADYASHVDPRANPTPVTFMLPQLMATRLLKYAQSNFVPANRLYVGSSLPLYVTGYQASPVHTSQHNLHMRAVVARSVEEAALHVLGNESGAIVMSFIGMPDQQALCNLGEDGPFGIAACTDLMRAYGATRLGRIVGTK